MQASPRSVERTAGESRTAVLVVAFIVIALIIPTIMLTQPRPARLGWQMYSASQSALDVQLELSDGSRRSYDIAARLAVARGDFVDPAAIGRQVCAMASASAAIVKAGNRGSVRVPCS